MADRGLLADRHQRRARAHRRRPDRRGRRPLRRASSWSSTRAMEAEDRARSSPGSPAGCASTPRRCGRRTESRRWSRTGPRRSIRPGPRPASSSPVEDGPTVIVLPGPPRELHAMWPAAIATDGARRSAGAARRPTSSQTVRMFGIPESEIAKSLREIEAEHGPLAARDHHLPAPRRARDRDPPPAGRRGDARGAGRRAASSATSAFVFSTDGSTIDEQVAALLRDGAPDRARRVVHGGPARGAACRPAGRLGLPRRAASSPTPTRPRSSCSACPRT